MIDLGPCPTTPEGYPILTEALLAKLGGYGFMREPDRYVSRDDAAVNAIIAAHDFAADYRDQHTRALRREAQRRIAQKLRPGTDIDDPAQMQDLLIAEINMTARGTELSDQRKDAPLTAAEDAERLALRAAFGAVKELRALSNAQTAALADKTLAELVAYDPATTPRWPA